MKKYALLLICLFLLISTALCSAEDSTFNYRFADAEEAAELLLSI